MRLYGWLVILFYSNIGLGQIELSGGFERDTVVIGDEATFTINVKADATTEIIGVTTYFLDSIYGSLESIKAQTDTSQALMPKIADFEVIDYNNWSDEDGDGLFTATELNWKISESGSERLFQSSFVIRVWDPGVTIVPFPVIIYSDGVIQDQLVNEGQMSVFVVPPGGLPASQDSLSVAPIKNIQEEPIHFSDYVAYFIIIGIAILGGLIYWWYSKYKKNKAIHAQTLDAPVIYIPPHKKAFGKLAELRSKELWQNGEIKRYQSELTYIIREYLEGRYNIAALESTTDEIVKNLLAEMRDKEDVVSLKRILQVADLVKFAKAKPAINIHDAFMDEAVSFVDKTKQELVIEEEGDD